MTGSEYAKLIAAHLLRAYGARGVRVYREVTLGKTIIGKNRRVDVLLVHEPSNVAMAIECKFQDSAGTVDEKIPYALEDLGALGMPVLLVYAGDGFSEGIQHMLAASPIAARCLPRLDAAVGESDTRELDVAVAMTFRFWDVIVAGKTPFEG